MTATILVRFIVAPLIQISTLNGVTTVRHNFPMNVPVDCKVISETEFQCKGDAVTLEAL